MSVSAEAQTAVAEFFNEDAPQWHSIYHQSDLFSVIHQRRQHIAMDWVRSLNLRPGAKVLEVGCGAGLLAIALAGEGFDVTAGDATDAMLDLAATNANLSAASLTLKKLDAHRLDARTDEFELVVALGVIPWLHSPDVALREMARVLRPGGHVIVNADNSARLQSWLDPAFSPPLAPIRSLKRRLRSRGRGAASGSMPNTIRHSRRAFDKALHRVGLMKLRGQTFGFGPFTLLGRRVFTDRSALKLDMRLQGLADRGIPLLRSTGAQYIVLTRKS